MHATNPKNQHQTIRVAAIDIGSNSIRLTVAEADAPGRYRVLTDQKATARLGSTNPDGSLNEQRIQSAAQTVANMAQTARGHNATAIRAVATAAVRDAPNAQRFTQTVQRLAGIKPETLTGDDEARLAHDSVAHAFDLSQLQAAVIDIGGGSTDIAISTSGVIQRLITVPVGVLRLANKHGETDNAHNAAYHNMRRDIEHALEKHLPKRNARPAIAFGTGGTFTALADLRIEAEQNAQNTRQYNDAPPRPNSVRGHEIRLADVAHTLYDLRRLDENKRAKLAALSPQRAQVIIPGLTIIDATMRRLHTNTLRVHDRGVRDGIILQLIREHFDHTADTTATRHDHTESVINFGRRCGFDEQQAQHVAQLALSIFDQLAQLDTVEAAEQQPPPWATQDNRRILHAAALLRDVGYFVNYKGHHKHSYHLIAHAELPPFTPHHTELIALTARYHRKAKPKKKHEAFNRLNDNDKHAVRTLAAILRIADGLDRTHARLIDSVLLSREHDAIAFTVHAHHNPAADLAGARHKATLFQSHFDTHTRFTWNHPAGNDLTPQEPSPENPNKDATYTPERTFSST